MNIQSAYDKMLRYRTVTETGCWLYTTPSRRSKREILVHGKNKLVARVSAVINHGMHLYSSNLVCHKCREMNCWNPDHIYIGNTSSNTRDAIKDGTYKNGNSNKTHCGLGHELSGQNLYIHKDKDGLVHRWCRKCRSLAAQRHKSRKNNNIISSR